MSAFFGNMLIALKNSISATTLSALNNATTSSITASVSGGRGTYTYLWVQSGTSCTITSSTAATTTFTGSSVSGTTTVYCAIRDTLTGNTLNTDNCTITWTTPTPISVTITSSIAAGGVSPQTISVLSITGGSGSYTLGTWSRVSFVGGTGGTVSAVGNGTGSATASRGGAANTSSTFRVVITDSLGSTGTSNNCVISWNVA